MKSYPIIKHIALVAFTLSVFFSTTSCKKANKEAQLNTDTQSVIFRKGQAERFFSIVNTGNEPLDYTLRADSELISITPTSGELGFNQTQNIKIQIKDIHNLPYGNIGSNIEIESNVGSKTIAIEIQNPAPLPAKLSCNYDLIKINSDQESTEIEITNMGEVILDYNIEGQDAFLSFEPQNGSLNAHETKVIKIMADKSQLADGVHTAHFNILSNGGNATITTEIEKNIYSISFYNPTYTTIKLKEPNDTVTHLIPPGEYYTFLFNQNPATFVYHAETKGSSESIDIIGLQLTWSDTLNVSQISSPIFDLDVSANIFFMKVRNNGTHTLDDWSVNNGTEQQIDDNVVVPNDGNIYNFGYYDALNGTKIFAHIVGTNDVAYWANGTHFTFSNTKNQSVLLESDLKSQSVHKNRIRTVQKGSKSNIKAKISFPVANKSNHHSHRSLLPTTR